ncbi:MAG: hypothetical protein KDD22_02570 [Bdellovibrionales bacterium]|nr:hypothetical protein [Bdellovibrionales bacterium]
MNQWLTVLIILMGQLPLAAFAQDLEPQDLILDGISCEGNELTDCDVIQREVYLNPGQHLDEDEIENARIRLQLTGLFNQVHLRLEKSEMRGHVILVVEVEEASALFTETYLNVSSFRHPPLSFTVGHRNLFGRGKILSASLNPSEMWDYTHPRSTNLLFNYTDPHLWGHKKYFMGAGSRFDFIDTSDIRDESNFSKLNSYGYSVNFGRRFFDFSYFTIGRHHHEYNYKFRNNITTPYYERKNTLNGTSLSVCQQYYAGFELTTDSIEAINTIMKRSEK